ncbi:Hypothetical predicted protein, partial [Paramuricea clavata]
WQPCRREYLRIAQEGPAASHVLPRCDDQGLYKPLQRTSSNFECYLPNGESDNIYNYPGEGACRQLKQCLKNHTSEGVEDHRLIRCDKFGLFEPLQKQEDGSTICALPEGEFPEPYGVAAGKRECIDSQPCAQTAQESSERDMSARCDDQGRFKPLQRFNEKLECYFPNGADFINEYAVRGPCRKLKQCLRQKYRTSKGVKEHEWIRCDKYGYFKPLQKQENGKMICVDVQGNIRKSFGVTGKQDCSYAVIIS